MLVRTVTAQDIDPGRLLFELAQPGKQQDVPQRQDAGTTPDEAEEAAREIANLDAIDRYRLEIDNSIESGESYSGLIREQYFSLGVALQQAGEHESAITTFEQAMQIDRVNEGLFTLSQQDLVEAIIESHESLGNYREVADYREYLYLVQLRSYAPDDPRLLAAKEDWADWNMRSYLADKARDIPGMSISTNAGVDNDTDYVAVFNPRLGTTLYVPRNQMPNLLNPISNPGAGDLYQRSMTYAVAPEAIIDQRLKRAEALYEEILDPEREGVRSDRENEVQEKLAAIAFAKKKQVDAIENNSVSAFPGNMGLRRSSNPVVTRGFVYTREQLEAVIAELENDESTPPFALAEAWVKLGDWQLAYDRNQRGLDAYARAWSVLESAGYTETDITDFLNPATLVPIPSFTIAPYSRESAGLATDIPLDYKGYIDLTLDINRYGDIRRRNVTAESEGTPQVVRRKLLDFLEEQPMRPRIENGAATAQDALTVRYYYYY